MTVIRSRKHALAAQPLLNHSLLALASLGLPLAAQAQAQHSDTTMAEVTVQASADPGFKAERASSPKLSQPLLDTAQTVTVIKKEVLQEQGASSIVEALRNTPGITLQLGENGNTSAGDTFQMRGFSTQGAIFVDGIRDLGPVSREAFNVEQVEVAKGPAGADIGRGAASGYINLVSKLPTREDSSSATLGFTQGGTTRATADLTRRVGSSGAVRLNALLQDGEQPGRRPVARRSRAIAPALAWGLDSPTRLYLYSQHTRQDNTPDGGLPSVGLPGFYAADSALRNAPRVERHNYYGYASDYEKVEADMLTAKIEHSLAPQVTLTNTTRYGKASMDRILTGVYTINASGPAATWTLNRLRQSVLQDNTILANTTNLLAEFRAGGLQHTLSAGLELLSEEQLSQGRSGLGTPTEGRYFIGNLYRPDPAQRLLDYAPVLDGSYSEGRTRTLAVYAFDTVKLNEQWQINGGVRAERYNTSSDAATLSGTALLASRLEKSDHLLSFKAGLLYKPAANGSVYLAYANSKTPPGSANFSLSAREGNINGPGMEPQTTSNLELGSKWDVIEKALALTAAVYRTENRNEITQLDAATNEWSQLGKRRVQGVELGAVGQLTARWNITAGLATMDSSIKQGTTGNNATGAATRWSPKLSATLWTSYRVDDRFSLGAGARYLSEQKRVVAPGTDLALQNLPAIPGYAVLDAMLSYRASKHVTLQLNVYNLFDKFYLNTLNNSGARATLGAPRYAQLSANFMF